MTEGHAWSDWLEVGDFDLDNDHHLQMRLVSSLIDAIEEGRPWLAHRLAEHLRDSTVVHFDAEEDRMRRSAFAERAAHRQEHDALLASLNEIVGRVDEEDTAEVLAAAIDLRSTLAAHIGSWDRRLAEHEAVGAEEPYVPAP